MIESFRFSTPDPDRIWRLFARWDSGHFLTDKEIGEIKSLTKEWIVYYLYLGNLSEAKKIKKKKDSILRKMENSECIKTKTSQGVKYAKKKQSRPLETYL